MRRRRRAAGRVLPRPARPLLQRRSSRSQSKGCQSSSRAQCSSSQSRPRRLSCPRTRAGQSPSWSSPHLPRSSPLPSRCRRRRMARVRTWRVSCRSRRPTLSPMECRWWGTMRTCRRTCAGWRPPPPHSRRPRHRYWRRHRYQRQRRRCSVQLASSRAAMSSRRPFPAARGPSLRCCRSAYGREQQWWRDRCRRRATSHSTASVRRSTTNRGCTRCRGDPRHAPVSC